METITEVYLAFVEIPDFDKNKNEIRYHRYYVENRKPDGITNELMAKPYSRKKDAENAAKWMRDNIRPNFYNGLDFTAKGKRCGVLRKKIIEVREETLL